MYCCTYNILATSHAAPTDIYHAVPMYLMGYGMMDLSGM